jgi:predicted DNA-binding transcriptional regulator AlpA
MSKNTEATGRNEAEQNEGGANPAPAQQPTRLIDKRAVGRLLGFSARHIDNLLAQGLPHFKIGARRVRFNADEVLAWCKEQFHTSRIGPAKGAQ